MAFTPATLSVIVQPIGGEGMRFLSYRTDDAVATITASDYFTRASSYGVRAHDLIFVSPFSGSVEPYILVVVSIDDEGNATASVDATAIADVAGLQAALDAKQAASINLDAWSALAMSAKQAASANLTTLAEATTSPKTLGAVADGVVDDTTAVINAITSGLPLDWGGPENIYRITAQIAETLTEPINWTSRGAKILFDPPASTQYALRLSVGLGVHKVSGVLEIDANSKAYSGIRIDNAAGTLTGVTVPAGLPDVMMDDLFVHDCYRAALTFTGGDGIYISGGFNRVHLTRPKVTDGLMAVGANVPGSQGIFGISIVDDNNGNSPCNIVIDDPFIDNITNEDATNGSDQGGIRVFSHYDGDTDNPVEAGFLIRGGVIRNCRNRSIKGQMQWGSVIGTRLVRNADADPGGLGTGGSADIDLQVGGGSVVDIEVDYDGFVPLAIATFGESVRPTKITSMPVFQNIRGVIRGGAELPSVVRLVGAEDAGKFTAGVNDINLVGPVGTFVTVVGGVDAVGTQRFNLSNAFAELTEAAVTFLAAGPMRAFLTNVHNTDETLVPLFLNTGGNTTRPVSAVNCTGFSEYSKITATEAPAVSRVSGIAPLDSVESGFMRPLSFNIANGATVDLPTHGYGIGAHMLMVSIGISNNTYHGLFGVSNAGVIALTPEATNFTVGTTSEPGSGNFRIWSGGSGFGPKISNRSGTARQVFVVQIG